MRNLTAKQKKFVRILATTDKDAVDALKLAGYKPKSRRNARYMASELLHLPAIQNALQIEIERQFPEMKKTVGSVLFDAITNEKYPISSRLRAIELLVKICGWLTPIPTATQEVTVKDLLLPFDERSKYELTNSSDNQSVDGDCNSNDT